MTSFKILSAATEPTHALIAQAFADGAVCHRVATLIDLEAALAQAWDAVIATATAGSIEPLLVLYRVRALSDAPFFVVGDHLSATDAVKLIKAGADDYLELADLAQLPKKIAQLCPIQAPIQAVAIARPTAAQPQLDRLERSQMQAAFSLQVASLTSVGEATAFLSPLCEQFGWDVGEIWVATAQALLPIAQWCSPAISSFELHCSRGDALLPSSIDPCGLEPIEARRVAAAAQGLQTVWSIPICAGRDQLGALVVYSRQSPPPPPPPPDFLKFASVLTARLGQLLKQQQNELALQQLAAIATATEDAIIRTDLEGRVLSWQGGAERMYGYSAAEAIGQPLTRLICPSDDRLWRKAALTNATAPHSVQHQRKTGEPIEVQLTLSLIHTQQRISGLTIVAKETSRHALDRLKDELISTISHELRTPIAALHGSIELLLSGKLGELSDRGQQLLQLAARNSDRLVRLTNNIFDLEQLAGGQVQLVPQACQIVELIEQAAIAVHSAAAQASIQLRIQLQPAEIFADPKRITQVLTNLLSNAIKFSATGDTIWLTVEQRSHLALSTAIPITASAESYVVIQVKDEGLGIPADRLEAIFQRFGQVDASDARPQSGAGLGLTLCRSIARRHQGHLWVESKIGQGSSFYLALPIASAAFPIQPGNTRGDRGVKNLMEVARGS